MGSLFEAQNELHKLSNVTIYNNKSDSKTYDKIVHFLDAHSKGFSDPVYITHCDYDEELQVIESSEELVRRSNEIIFNTASKRMMFKVDDNTNYRFFVPIEKSKLKNDFFINYRLDDYIIRLSDEYKDFTLD